MDRPCHILAIEDDEDVTDLYRQVFAAEGLEFSATSTIEAARLILASTEIDLILIDVVLSQGTSGITMAAEFVAEGRRVILVTGHHDYFESVERSGLRFLHKPFRIPHLLKYVDAELHDGQAQCLRKGGNIALQPNPPSVKPS